MFTIQGMQEAAQREAQGKGALSVSGKCVTYSEGGYSFRFWYPRPAVAAQALRVSRNIAAKGA